MSTINDRSTIYFGGKEGSPTDGVHVVGHDAIFFQPVNPLLCAALWSPHSK